VVEANLSVKALLACLLLACLTVDHWHVNQALPLQKEKKKIKKGKIRDVPTFK